MSPCMCKPVCMYMCMVHVQLCAYGVVRWCSVFWHPDSLIRFPWPRPPVAGLPTAPSPPLAAFYAYTIRHYCESCADKKSFLAAAEREKQGCSQLRVLKHTAKPASWGTGEKTAA